MDKKSWSKLALLVVAILWGTSLTVIKSASDAFNPNFILAIRFSLSAIILAVLFRDKLKNARKDEIGTGAILAVILFISYSAQSIGVTYADPGRSGFLSASYCVMVPFIYWMTNKVRPDRFNMIAAVLCVMGIFFIGMAGESGSILDAPREAILGDLLALASGIFFAIHIVAITHLGVRKDPFVLTIVQFTVVAILSWITTLVIEDNSGLVFSLRPTLEVLYLSVFCTAIALLLQNLGQKHVDPNSASIILGSESIFGVILPVALGIETLTKNSIIGFALIFMAMIISETKLEFILKRFRKAQKIECKKEKFA